MDESAILVARVRAWARFAIVPEVMASCDRCRVVSLEIRETSARECLCLPCWLHLPQCCRCGWGPGVNSWEERVYCESCLNPEPDAEYLLIEWEHWAGRRRAHPLAGARTEIPKVMRCER